MKGTEVHTKDALVIFIIMLYLLTPNIDSSPLSDTFHIDAV